MLAALDRLEAELDGGEYLVGDRFSVADLTAAALLYPLVFPPEGPSVPPPAGYERFRAPLADRPGYRWVEEMFRRHRSPAPAPVAAEPAEQVTTRRREAVRDPRLPCLPRGHADARSQGHRPTGP